MEEIKDKVLQPENEIAHQLLQNISTDEVPTQITDIEQFRLKTVTKCYFCLLVYFLDPFRNVI